MQWTCHIVTTSFIVQFVFISVRFEHLACMKRKGALLKSINVRVVHLWSVTHLIDKKNRFLVR